MEHKTLTLGSLFDGSAGFPLGGILAGITPVWASEVEPFAVRVTTKRLPFMKHYGDITLMDGAKIEPVDIITFGSPCQDMSVAGKRSGLDGSRSSLFYEAVRIIKEMRESTHGEYPKYIVWENVPGALSSGKPKGADFRSVLTEICRVCDPGVDVPLADKWLGAGEIVGDGYSVAWRILDAQYWGVPQRRKRIYLVGDLTGGRAGNILFESEGMSGYSAEGFRAWQRAAGSAADRAGASGRSVDGYNSAVSDVAATLGVNCGMSTGRNGVMEIMCLNTQGHSGVDLTIEKTNALVSQAHGNEPCVVESAGFCTEHSAKARSIGYEDEKSPTLRAGVVPAAISLEHNPSDGRLKIMDEDVAQTLCGRMGTGGNNVPLLLKIRCGREGGGKGPLIQEDRSATLSCNNDQTLFQPKVYGICSDKSNSMLSGNPNSGIYEADTTRTLDGNGDNPACNQGGMIVLEGNGSRPSHLGNGYAESETMYTLNATEQHGVAYGMTTGSFMQTTEDTSPTLMARDWKDPNCVSYGIGRDAFNQGQNAKFMPSVDEEVQPTLVAKGPGAVAGAFGFDPQRKAEATGFEKGTSATLVNGTNPGYHNGVVDDSYIVRRLTPTECARLQGFPDWWCAGLETDEPTEADIAFWRDVFETQRGLTGASAKPKTDNQIVKWLKNPTNGASEYRLWGNGVALPCVFFVLSGIVWADNTMINRHRPA